MADVRPDHDVKPLRVVTGIQADAAFDQCFSLIAFALNRHLIDHMLRAMRELEVENSKLKRMYADLSMQNDLLKEALGKK